MITFPAVQVHCDRCFFVVKTALNDGCCLSCAPMQYEWPGTIPITDLLPAGHAALLLDRLRAQEVLSPPQLAVWYALSHGSAREEDRPHLEAARDWEVPKAKGEWYGTPETRAKGVIVRCLHVESLGAGEYGERFKCVMEVLETADAASGGPLLVWWTGENCWLFTDGRHHPENMYTVDFSIDSHGVFQSTKQTKVSRVNDPTGTIVIKKPKKGKVTNAQ